MPDLCSCADCNDATPCADRLRRVADLVEKHEEIAGDHADVTISLHGDGGVHVDIHYDT